jgi:hypothetical protein
MPLKRNGNNKFCTWFTVRKVLALLIWANDDPAKVKYDDGSNENPGTTEVLVEFEYVLDEEVDTHKDPCWTMTLRGTPWALLHAEPEHRDTKPVQLGTIPNDGCVEL